MLLVCDFVCSGISHDLALLYQLSAADMACIVLFHFVRVPKCGYGKYRVARHHFAGAWCTSVPAATSDVCDRVLWYFGVGVRS